jgi:A/G-specific adenine glycosylase
VTTKPLEDARNDALLAWYADQKRDLPWRGEADPYRILVAEVMLQQTQAVRVVPFYDRFVAAFPTAGDLASAVLQDVLDAWSGLGYNARAMRLREAARIVHADGWPTKLETLMDLPGVGPYTASAIASFAFGAQVPAIDTNLRRVLSRWHGESLNGAALSMAAKTALGEPASDWNQAMMDLGATRCTPKSPRCGVCPVQDWCAGPAAYVPPTAQARFEGSSRQLRGAIVRALVRGPLRADDIIQQTGFPAARVEAALSDLSADGLILARPNGSYRIAD